MMTGHSSSSSSSCMSYVVSQRKGRHETGHCGCASGWLLGCCLLLVNMHGQLFSLYIFVPFFQPYILGFFQVTAALRSSCHIKYIFFLPTYSFFFLSFFLLLSWKMPLDRAGRVLVNCDKLPRHFLQDKNDVQSERKSKRGYYTTPQIPKPTWTCMLKYKLFPQKQAAEEEDQGKTGRRSGVIFFFYHTAEPI